MFVVRLRSLVLSCLALSVATGALEAQRRGRDWPPQHRRTSPQFGLDAGGLFTRGSSSTTGDAAGLEVMGSVGSGLFSVGGGFQRNAVRAIAPADRRSDVLDGFFVEPRLALPLAVGNFTPYVFGRFGWLTNRLEGTNSARLNESASQVGGGLGTLIWLAPQLQLNTALVALDTRAPRSLLDGRSLGLRVGATVGLDRWGR
jgi:hypothetical protein